MGKGAKGGYYSSGSGGDCDCDAEFPKCPWSLTCWMVTTSWFIYALVLAFATVPQHRYNEDPIVHSGEMRLLELPAKNPYTYSTSEFSDNLGLVDWYQISSEPPLLTPTAAAAQNKSARVVVEALRDTYGFPEQYDWWYQNAWMTPGSSVLLQARCTGAAWLNIITGDYAFSKWKVGANGEDERLDRGNWVATRRFFNGGDASLLWVQPTPSDEIYFTVMKDSTDEGDTIDCSMTVNITLVPYDLSGLTKTFPASRLTRTIDQKDAPFVLLVAPIPGPNRPWFDIGCHIKQNIPNILTVGPLMGLMFAGMAALTVGAVILDYIDCTRKCCKEFSCNVLFPMLYCWACDVDWGWCRCQCCNIFCCCCDDPFCICRMDRCCECCQNIKCCDSDPNPMTIVQPGATLHKTPKLSTPPPAIELRAAEPVKADPTAQAATPISFGAAPPVAVAVDPVAVVVVAAPDVPVADRNAGPSAPPPEATPNSS